MIEKPTAQATPAVVKVIGPLLQNWSQVEESMNKVTTVYKNRFKNLIKGSLNNQGVTISDIEIDSEPGMERVIGNSGFFQNSSVIIAGSGYGFMQIEYFRARFNITKLTETGLETPNPKFKVGPGYVSFALETEFKMKGDLVSDQILADRGVLANVRSVYFEVSPRSTTAGGSYYHVRQVADFSTLEELYSLTIRDPIFRGYHLYTESAPISVLLHGQKTWDTLYVMTPDLKINP